ncbi:universal stress protein [Tropicimonas sp. IMCC34011]|uniref:universal stress protein n=1 Tax=Tropicimonas sp. IMCC34011 TaxID=2248759 RepID=UPI000E27CC2A|nr:universal stress protein [Tropicimonas sp. IMCC34011]
MYQNILIPVAPDQGDVAHESLAVARELAGEGAKITAVSVVEQVPLYMSADVPAGLIDQTRADIAASLEEVLKDAPDVSRLVVSGHAPSTIVQMARDNAYDLIVIRSHRPGLQDFFLGSTAARVVRHAGTCVHVIR